VISHAARWSSGRNKGLAGRKKGKPLNNMIIIKNRTQNQEG
jgi:hypothetical protein